MILTLSGANRPKHKKGLLVSLIVILIVNLFLFFTLVLLPPIAVANLPKIVADWMVGQVKEIFSSLDGKDDTYITTLCQGWIDDVYPQFAGYEVDEYPKLYLAESYSFYYYFINEKNIISSDTISMSDYMKYFKSTASDTEIMNQLKADHDFILYDEGFAEQLSKLSDALLNNATQGDGDHAGDGTVIGNAIAWALNVASDDSHGYCMNPSHRLGNPEYDCSSFVTSAFKYGAHLSSVGVSNTTSMLANMSSQGFTIIPYAKSKLQKGDILIYDHGGGASGHTELYIGNNQTVGAHMNIHANGYSDGYCDGTANDQRDLSGQEISVATLSDYSGWEYIIRYTGNPKFELDK